MENSISSRTPANLRDKVIHADIRIDSIEHVPENGAGSSQSPTVVAQGSQNFQTAEDAQADKVNAARKQAWWQSAIEKYMGLNDGYKDVAVLLIKWIDGLDDLNTRPEVRVSLALSSLSKTLLTSLPGRRIMCTLH